MLRVVATAAHTSVLARLDEMQKEKNRLADARAARASEDRPPIIKPRLAKPPKPLKMIKGNLLAPSKTRRYPIAPEACTHPDSHLKPRANDHLEWLTCLLCGSRWERLEGPAASPAAWLEASAPAPAPRPPLAASSSAAGRVPPCKTCGKKLEARLNDSGQPIWACSDFPTCKTMWRPTRATQATAVAIHSDTSDMETQEEEKGYVRVIEQIMTLGASEEDAVNAVLQNMTSLDQVKQMVVELRGEARRGPASS